MTAHQTKVATDKAIVASSRSVLPKAKVTGNRQPVTFDDRVRVNITYTMEEAPFGNTRLVTFHKSRFDKRRPMA